MSFFDDFEEIEGYEEQGLPIQGIEDENPFEEIPDQDQYQDQLQQGFDTRMGGEMKGDRKQEMYHAELKNALDNREEPLSARYYSSILNLPNYMKLNPSLLADVLEMYYRDPKPSNKALKEKIQKLTERDGVTYNDADVLRYWRFVTKKFSV